MEEGDLIELVQSFLEEDAIVSRLFSYFHLRKGYKISVLNSIISVGVKEEILLIIDSRDDAVEYASIEWTESNIYQEVVFKDSKQYIPILFSEQVQIPDLFLEWLEKDYY